MKKLFDVLTVIITAVAVMIAAGCATQPSRAQINNYDNNVFLITFGGADSLDGVARQPQAVGDLFSQNMMIEQSGTVSESNTPSFDVSPQTTASYYPPGASLVSAGAGLLKGKGAAAAPAAAVADAAACADGSCSDPAPK